MVTGPGPGEKGGQIVFDGSTQDLKNASTLTGDYLGGRKQVGMGFKRLVTDNTPRLILEGAKEHNLKDVSIEFPLQRLVCVTGVSGSGKSSLIQDVLAPALLRHFGKSTETPGAHDRLLGADHLSDVVFVDQSPIGKTARVMWAHGTASEKFLHWRLCLNSAATRLLSSALTVAMAGALHVVVQGLSTWRCSS